MKSENYIPALLAELKYLMTHFVEIGIFSDSTRDDNTPMLVIAYVHEFGAQIPKRSSGKENTQATKTTASNSYIVIPERSYLRAGFDANIYDITQEFEYLISQVLTLKISGSTALNLIGASVTTKIQEYLVNLKEPPLKPATIKAKGSSNPLVDTGQLMNSITWKITEVKA